MRTVLPQCDRRPVAELIGAALSAMDEDVGWDAVAALHWRGTEEVLVAAQKLCRSRSDRERELGCDILGQLGVPERTFPTECARILLDVLEAEAAPTVLRSIFVAFSHLGDERGANSALSWVAHEDHEVRHAVVLALASFESDKTVSALTSLTTDDHPHVRDWATFSLAQQTKADSPAIREALAARLSDVDADTRGEALVGLANRGDERAVAAVNENADAFSTTDHLGFAQYVLREKGLV